MRLLTVIASVVTMPAVSVAHPPLGEQVESVSAEIRAHPGSAERFLERAELHRRLGHLERAAADYEEALLLQPDLAAVWLGRARLYLAQGEVEPALEAVDRYLAQSDDFMGFLVRSRVLAALGRPLDAAADLNRAIERHPAPDPSLFLERARRLAETGPD
ncbi:MAG: tetratricopeptide repeat protein, partial [bacterium]